MELNLLELSSSEQLNLLDWDKILKELCGYAHFQRTNNLLQAPPRQQHRDWIELEFDSLAFFLENDRKIDDFFRYHITKIPSSIDHLNCVAMLEKNIVGNLSNLNFMALCLEAFQVENNFFDQWIKTPDYTFPGHVLSKLKKDFLIPFRVFVSPDASIDYDRHPVLGPLYIQLRSLEEQIRSQLNVLAQTSFYLPCLQYQEHDLINDHYVLAIRADHYRANLGPIISRSNTAQTFFVEPSALQENSRKRREILSLIEETLSQILVNFFHLLHPHHFEIQKICQWCIDVDHARARAHYCQTHKLVRPELSLDLTTDMEDFFHPLIDAPVLNSIDIPAKKKGFILSGPNTGGKTVVLKSITLAHLFLHFGLYVPAANAILCPVENIYYFALDQQNLSVGLSSFAAEVQCYLYLLSKLGNTNLIVIDEIFNSTSSEEASALAMALLREIHDRAKAQVIISTHHQMLKTFMHQNDEYISAHMCFAEDLMMPTYKISFGHPGSSMAFCVMRKISDSLGITTIIPDIANMYLDQKQITYEQLLQDLSKKNLTLDNLVAENRSLNHQLKNQIGAAQGLLELKKGEELEKFRNQLSLILGKAQNFLNLVTSGEIPSRKSGERLMGEIQGEVRAITRTESLASDDSAPIDPSAINIGDIYFASNLNAQVRVVAIYPEKNEVLVSHKKVKIKLPANCLRLLKTPQLSKNQIEININKTEWTQLQVDARGLRLSEFQNLIEQALIALHNKEIPFLHIIHGHGEGVLKNWLRKHLQKQLDLTWTCADGNDGITKIELR
jgi:DNA mismatch repair protein MutS2